MIRRSVRRSPNKSAPRRRRCGLRRSNRIAAGSCQIFQGDDRTSDLARQFIDKFVGKPSVTSDKVRSIWNGLLNRLAQLKTLARDFETIDEVTRAIAAAGAPEWARMLSAEKAVPDDPRTSPAWREAWDHAAADAQLARIDARQKLTKLAAEREAAEKRCRHLFVQIVRERTFYQLDTASFSGHQGGAGRIRARAHANRSRDRQNRLDASANGARRDGKMLWRGAVLDHADVAGGRTAPG